MVLSLKLEGICICSRSKNPNILPGDLYQLSNFFTNTNIEGFFRKIEKIKIPYYVLSRKFYQCSLFFPAILNPGSYVDFLKERIITFQHTQKFPLFFINLWLLVCSIPLNHVFQPLAMCVMGI